MHDVQRNYTTIKKQILLACQQANKNSENIKLLAVSKGRDLAHIKSLLAKGQLDFGENKAQEAVDKIISLSNTNIIWHFIGPIQSNKAKIISEHFQWTHSLDRLKIASLLNKHRPKTLSPLNVCVQVNIDQEPQKSGILPCDLEQFISELIKLDNLRLRGLMCIPKKSTNSTVNRETYLQVAQIYNHYAKDYDFDTLSMGMSTDFPEAIASGANLIRIGTALFGPK
ncbi:MAG: YggS family pyridoxal phosphate-dependent enzyme [Francisellaceae bacterium]|jgi:PLP dependent protein|nr:YggS family pyridoxal phosphate-dependent enzyme [Francisellaceae bacterium]MBT6538698.1 YggS family pyridoxal phosphate-dependent enzyme [Francisellaceae bacterium]